MGWPFEIILIVRNSFLKIPETFISVAKEWRIEFAIASNP